MKTSTHRDEYTGHAWAVRQVEFLPFCEILFFSPRKSQMLYQTCHLYKILIDFPNISIIHRCISGIQKCYIYKDFNRKMSLAQASQSKCNGKAKLISW